MYKDMKISLKLTMAVGSAIGFLLIVTTIYISMSFYSSSKNVEIANMQNVSKLTAEQLNLFITERIFVCETLRDQGHIKRASAGLEVSLGPARSRLVLYKTLYENTYLDFSITDTLGNTRISSDNGAYPDHVGKLMQSSPY